jgi:predicted transcriptional regulator
MKPRKKSLDIIQEIIKNKHNSKQELADKIYHCKFNYNNVIKLNQFIDRNKNLIKEINGKFFLTDEAKQFLNTEPKYINEKIILEAHKITFMIRSIRDIEFEMIEYYAKENNYRIERKGFNGSIIVVHDVELQKTIEFCSTNNIIIHFKQEVRGEYWDLLLNEIKRQTKEILPLIEKKYKIKLEKNLFGELAFNFTDKHLLYHSHPFDLWLRQNDYKLKLWDIKENKAILILDKSKGYNHQESEVTFNEKVMKEVDRHYIEVIEGYSIKKNTLEIEQLTMNNNNTIITFDNITKILNAQMEIMNEMKKQIFRLKFLKQNIKTEQDLEKYKKEIEELEDFEKAELLKNIYNNK